MHYDRWRKNGDPLVAKTLWHDDAGRFWQKVIKDGPDGCWDWTGQKTAGYGRLSAQGRGRPGQKTHLAHRFAYKLLVGPVPAGLQLDHLCKNRSCVNPAHLEPVTPQENVLRTEGPPALNARKTHCPRGHPYSEENTWFKKSGRTCKTCARDRRRAAA